MCHVCKNSLSQALRPPSPAHPPHSTLLRRNAGRRPGEKGSKGASTPSVPPRCRQAPGGKRQQGRVYTIGFIPRTLQVSLPVARVSSVSVESVHLRNRGTASPSDAVTTGPPRRRHKEQSPPARSCRAGCWETVLPREAPWLPGAVSAQCPPGHALRGKESGQGTGRLTQPLRWTAAAG